MADRAEMFQRARAMRREPTEAERVMWRLLRSRQFEGLKFRRQVPIGCYIADFVCLSPRLIIECDGGQHADSAYDAERNAWFEAQGFRVLRFWNDAVVSETDGVVEMLLAALGRR
jgi:very-short-patch-repair endonuclease